MKRSDLFAPHRQSVVAIILILFKFIRMLIRQLWPVALILLFNRKGSTQAVVGIIVGILAIISLAGSVLAYFKFYYFIANNHLNIHKGLLRRTKVNIPFERIQTIDFEQNIIHQLFGVVRVKIDSAGSGGEEISFDALEKDRAEFLRDYILEQKAELTGDIEPKEQAEREARELILHLRPGDLVKIGISQNHLRTAAIIFAFFFALAEDVSEVLEDIDLFNRISTEVEALVKGSFMLALIAVPVFLLISFFVSLIRTVFVYYDTRFWKTTHGFKLVSGLITRKEKSAQKDKIQLIAWNTNPIRKLFGMFRMSLYQASSVEVFGDKSITVPGCYQSHVDRTIERVIPDAHQAEYEEHRVHPLARFRFILFAGLLPCIVLSAIGIVFGRQLAFIVWLYLPVAIWMGQLYYRKKRILLHPDLALLKGGIIGNEYKLLQIYKVQAVRLRQSFYQWRRDLATVSLYTASGDVSIPFIPIRKAEEIRDYVLYRIETDKRGWM